MRVENEAFYGEWEDALPAREPLKEVSETEASLAEAEEAARIDDQEAAAAEASRQRRREHVRQRMLSAPDMARTDRLLARLGYKLPEAEPDPRPDA
jgi:hypothetical protein